MCHDDNHSDSLTSTSRPRTRLVGLRVSRTKLSNSERSRAYKRLEALRKAAGLESEPEPRPAG